MFLIKVELNLNSRVDTHAYEDRSFFIPLSYIKAVN